MWKELPSSQLPPTPFKCLIYLNKIFKIIIKLKKLVQNIQRTLNQMPFRNERIWLLLDSPVHCLYFNIVNNIVINIIYTFRKNEHPKYKRNEKQEVKSCIIHRLWNNSNIRKYTRILSRNDSVSVNVLVNVIKNAIK